MTVGGPTSETGVEGLLQTVSIETEDTLQFTSRTGLINDGLTVSAPLSKLTALKANERLASMGVQLYGDGFILDSAEADRQEESINPKSGFPVVRPFINGRDIAATSRNKFVIDFFGLTEQEARSLHPGAFQILTDRVKPVRDVNRRDAIRNIWWRFGWERPVWRNAALGTTRYIATCRTAKHRVFTFVPIQVVAESKVVILALENAESLGILSSRIHVVFATATGGWLGLKQANILAI